jgi:phytoene desaturase (3,4-didehydrolycopene-forming)
VFSLLQALEFDQGIYYPIGGFQTIATALETLCSNAGVDIKLNHKVVDLTPGDDTRTIVSVGAETSSGFERYSADVFVLNQDVPQAEMDMIPPQARDKRSMEGRPSCGVVSLSFGLDIRLEQLCHHNILFSSEYERSWDAVNAPDTGAFNPTAFNCYVHAPSRTDPSCCPVGHDAITVLVPVPPLTRQGDSNTDVSIVRDAVLKRLQRIPGMPQDLTSHIVEESIREPRQWRSGFGLFRGSAFGLAHSLNQLYFFRPNIKHESFGNVYRVGASTRPGNGVPLVMIGARLTTDAVLKDVGYS